MQEAQSDQAVQPQPALLHKAAPGQSPAQLSLPHTQLLDLCTSQPANPGIRKAIPVSQEQLACGDSRRWHCVRQSSAHTLQPMGVFSSWLFFPTNRGKYPFLPSDTNSDMSTACPPSLQDSFTSPQKLPANSHLGDQNPQLSIEIGQGGASHRHCNHISLVWLEMRLKNQMSFKYLRPGVFADGRSCLICLVPCSAEGHWRGQGQPQLGVNQSESGNTSSSAGGT